MTSSEFLSELLQTLTHDFARYILGAGGVYLLINLCLAPLLSLPRIQNRDPRPGQMWREILLSLRTVLIFAAFGTSISVMAGLGLNRIYVAIESYSTLWFWTSLVLIILAHDGYFYWTHRLLHRPRLFRRWHGAHHQSRVPTPFASYSFDWQEAVLNAVFLLVWTVLVPMHPVMLLAFVVHMMLRNALAHCGYEVFPARSDGRPLIGWLTTVTHHDLHHRDGRWNMGFYFTFWDRLCGTEHPDYISEFSRASRRERRLPRLGLVLALAILPGLTLMAQPARALPAEGTYVTPGLGVILRIGPCAGAAGQSCLRLRLNGRDTQVSVAKHAQMEKPGRGGARRIVPLRSGDGTPISVWLREDRAGNWQVLRHRHAECDRMRWRPLRRMSPELRNFPGL